jgi:AraC-like DNA-binding protein
MDGLHFDFWDSLLVCGIIQGLIVAVLLISGKRRHTRASIFLSATLFIFASHNVLIVSRDSNLSEVYPLIENLPINLILGLGPCIYFYVFFSVYPGSSKPNVLMHFIPVTIQFCYYLLLTIKRDLHLGFSAWKIISQTEQVGALASVCVYTLMSLSILNTGVPQAKVTIKPDMYKWLKKLLWSYMLLWITWLGYTLTDIFFFNYSLTLRDYLPLYLLVSGLTYWIGIMAYLHPIIKISDTGNKAFNSMREEDIRQSLEMLQDIMVKEKMFFDPNLNLKQVAGKSGIPVNLISFIINNRLNKSFNDWINSFRIDEVKKQMQGARLKQVTIISIAFECGFNSKATFNRVFKQQTGLTPREYLFQINAGK